MLMLKMSTIIRMPMILLMIVTLLMALWVRMVVLVVFAVVVVLVLVLSMPDLALGMMVEMVASSMVMVVKIIKIMLAATT